MSLEINEILKKRKTISVEIADGIFVKMELDVNAFNPSNRAKLNDFPHIGDYIRWFLTMAIKSWDLTENGKPAEISERIIERLGDHIIAKMYADIREALSFDPKFSETTSDT